MFENLLGQAAADQLIGDTGAGVLAPAMLFFGPPASGKGTAALELGRVISCEAVADSAAGRAAWNCVCPACSRHRLLIHPDLLCLGFKLFSTEIAAAAGAFLRDASPSSRILFVRSVRKLLARFNPVLWEDEPKGGKVAPLVDSLEEDLDELDVLSSGALSSPDGTSSGRSGAQGASPLENHSSLVKLTEGMLKSAFKLESDGLSETVPIAQIRRAAWWSHLAPTGRGKLLIIENADRMLEEARNSLLKLLEEPPPRVTLILTTTRPGSLLPTILSRLRPYRFSARDAATEGEVIRRVFRDHERAASIVSQSAGQENRINAYLDSFLPVSGDTLDALSAFFAASVAYKAALLSKRQGRPISDEVVLLGKYCAPRAEAAGLGRPLDEGGAVIARILERAERFEIHSLFSRFLNCLLEQVSLSQRQGPFPFVPSAPYNEFWKKCTSWGETAVAVYKLRPVLVLEKLFTDLSRGMAEL